jgi:hypothetical protein
MSNNTPHLRAPRRRRGVGIVEVLISLAISAMLLTAITAAFAASAAVIQANDEFFRASQSARVSMTQILTEVRRAYAVSVQPGRIDLITSGEHDRSYSYDSANRRLLLITNDITTDPDYTLASNVTAATFTSDTEQDMNGITRVVRVSVVLVVKVGDNQVRLSGSAAPRRTQTYR